MTDLVHRLWCGVCAEEEDRALVAQLQARAAQLAAATEVDQTVPSKGKGKRRGKKGGKKKGKRNRGDGGKGAGGAGAPSAGGVTSATAHAAVAEAESELEAETRTSELRRCYAAVMRHSERSILIKQLAMSRARLQVVKARVNKDRRSHESADDAPAGELLD